ncbi:MAG: T9SS type A sorting domain-containing protein [Bacteroidia bacterium]
MTNNLGQVVHSFEMNSRTSTVDLSEIKDGIYTINIQTSKGMASRKIIKQGS